MSHPELLDFPHHIQRLRPYAPGTPLADVAGAIGKQEHELAQLASNENPLGPSPRALQALRDTPINLALYPDNDCHALLSALSSALNVPRDWIIPGAGSENVLSIAAATLLDPQRTAVFAQYSFQAFAAAVHRVGGQCVVAPSPDFHVNPQALVAAITPATRIVYVANPGNPTGTCLTPGQVLALVEAVPRPVLIILDEAYREYLTPEEAGDSLAWVRRYPNLLVTRTFSKAYGLAGLRVGYGVAQPHITEMLQRVRPMYGITQLAQVAAVAALHDHDFLRETVRVNAEGLAQLAAGFDTLGLRYVPSRANFMLVEVGNGADVAKRLETYGLLVRPVNSYGLPGWLRISVGLPETNQQLLAALKKELAR